MLAKNLEEANLGIPIETIDIDVHPELATEYGVRSVPTLILKEEKTETRLVGLQPVTKLKLWAMGV
jgi:thioredoxin-like negative regulator of GroEL